MDSEKLKIIGIKDFKYWEINLHEDQHYLGRCVVWCKRKDIVDFFDMGNEEKEEFWEITKKLRDVLKKTFGVDMLNYAALANTTPHLHIHVVPRYKTKKIFENKEFTDENWGHNYSPHEKFKPSNELLIKIRDKIKKNWN